MSDSGIARQYPIKYPTKLPAAASPQFMQAGVYPSVSRPLGPRYPPTAANHLLPGFAPINTLQGAVAYTAKRDRSESEVNGWLVERAAQA